MKEMEELQDDIKMHLDLDRESPVHVQYWEVIVLFLQLNFRSNTQDGLVLTHTLCHNKQRIIQQKCGMGHFAVLCNF